MDNILIIFAKAPVAGMVKTRLFPYLSFEEAAVVQRAFLDDTVEKALSAGPHRVCLAYTPDESAGLFRELYGDRVAHYHPQKGDDLGARMSDSFGCAFDNGARKVVIIGSDVPTLPSEHIMDAFRLLDEADIVLGPSMDGGYYLAGLKAPAPGLFTGMDWSTASVCNETVRRAGQLGMVVRNLSVLRDVDTFEDLRGLVGAHLPPHTSEVVTSMEQRLKAQHDWLL